MKKTHYDWIRVAGNAPNVRAGDVHVWRCFIGNKPNQIDLRNWAIAGTATERNFLPGTHTVGDAHGLIAWIDCYGSYNIRKEVLLINLGNPPNQSNRSKT